MAKLALLCLKEVSDGTTVSFNICAHFILHSPGFVWRDHESVDFRGRTLSEGTVGRGNRRRCRRLASAEDAAYVHRSAPKEDSLHARNESGSIAVVIVPGGRCCRT